MTAEQMKKLKELVLEAVYMDENGNNDIWNDTFFDLIEWVEEYAKTARQPLMNYIRKIKKEVK